MPRSSMNPHVSALSTHALSAHSLDVLRPLLRSIAMWHRGRTKMAPLELKLDFDDIDIDEADDPTVPDLSERHLALNEPYSFTPAASTMTPHEITAVITADRDPLAEAIDPSPDKTLFLPQPPMPTLIVAARFAALLASPELKQQITSPRAFSLITIPDRSEREVAWKTLDNVLRRLAELCDDNDDTWRDFDTPVLAAEPNRSKTRDASQRNDFEDAVEVSVKNGHKVLALTPDAHAMSPLMRAMCGRVLNWPALSGQMIMEILRATHTVTGELSEDAIADLLPPDSEIATFPLAAIESAFFEDTTLNVSKALAAAADRFRTVPPAATTLSDIALNANTRAPIDRLVADIASWKSGQVQWTEVSSSVLFHGPPGNGKTLLASALAGTLGVPLISTSYSDCQRHGHQGAMLNALSEKVNAAISAAPAVFFLDELDSFTHRDRPSRGSDYIVGVVNGLLEHLSRLNDTPGVIVLGATNYPDMVDPAVVRPGRFDRKIEIQNPDKSSILQILSHALGPDAKTLQLDPIADQLFGSSGAQITALVRDAHGLARAARTTLDQSHLDTAAATVCPALPRDILWRIAVHEVGHLVVAHALGLPPAERVTITRTGGTVSAPAPQLHTKQTANDEIAVLLAGHAAETVIFGNASNGAGQGTGNDLARATELAVKIRFTWGFKASLTQYSTGPELRIGANDATDQIINRALQTQYSRARRIIEDQPAEVDRIATALMDLREVSGQRLIALMTPRPTASTAKT